MEMPTQFLRRMTALLSLVLAVSLLSGCGLYDKEYSVVEQYPVAVNDSNKDSSTVHNFFEMEAAILNLVHQRQEQGSIVFDNYEGDISTDLKNACWGLRTRDAFCVYCVSGIQYEMNHIVSHEGADLTISYTRSPEEMEQIKTISFSTDLTSYAEHAIDSYVDRLVVLIKNCSLDEDGIRELVDSAYEENPVIALAAPMIQVKMFSGSGLQRLVEVEFSYGDDTQDLQQKKQEVIDKIGEITEQSADDFTEKSLLKAVNMITSQCQYRDEYVGNSVYSCLVTKEANSQGLALTLKSICNAMDIPCETVNGFYNQKEHYWNIVQIGSDYYHIDLSQCIQQGTESGFLRSDEEMWNDHRWDTSAYSRCSGPLTYQEVVKN